MADDCDFLGGDDLDAILDMLEADEGVEEAFNIEVENVQKQEIVCKKCGKKYKTKGGYERHQATKHSERTSLHVPFSATVLDGIVKNVLQNLKENNTHSEVLRLELGSYTWQSLDENGQEYKHIQMLFEVYSKNGSVEKFYAKFYSTIAVNSVKYFTGLSRNAATLLAMKLADNILVYCNKFSRGSTVKEVNHVLSDRDISCVQYLGGYVLHNLHKNHATKQSAESQQAMAILKAGKSEINNAQNLISGVTRGGLWFITQPAQKVFFQTELIFREFSSLDGLKQVDIPSITCKSVTDSTILTQYGTMVSEAELQPIPHVTKSVLYSIINLYVCVRSFSLAKDIIEKYKVNAKKIKAKALRKEISRKCDNAGEDRQD
ncbi:uncharacterized protein LOC122952995 [Acropora millepora]|uniref:uncharacterized protein LOC122952995 n=1 Tax=Acropora millepora TaxID=45264 RepID=UPI001CF2108D|nr:uncharacterized protein LOC122952995 [Acropora millepora]